MQMMMALPADRDTLIPHERLHDVYVPFVSSNPKAQFGAEVGLLIHLVHPPCPFDIDQSASPTRDEIIAKVLKRTGVAIMITLH